MSTTTISYGTGNTFNGDAIAAGNIQESFNKVADSEVSAQKQKSLQELVVAVGKLCEKLDHDQAQAVSRDLKTLVDEAASGKPRASRLKVTADGLIEAAKTVAAMAGPITTAVTAVLSVFGL